MPADGSPRSDAVNIVSGEVIGRSLSCSEKRHDDCVGCKGCSCHHVGPPANFRQLVQNERARVRTTTGGAS